MTGTIAIVTVFYFSQYFKAPTRGASWVLRFCKFLKFYFACHVIILLYLRTFYLFLINAFTLCTLSSWSFIL